MQLRQGRGLLIHAMMLDAAKSAEQADVEVSEAIDFAEYYASNYAWWVAHGGVRLQPKGAVLVAPPWNFPLAIPLGGVLAALVTGNTVVLKPALETVLVARRGAECLWAAGIPKDVLQFVMCEDEMASLLVQDPRTRAVILTGATETAQLLHRLRPGLDLAAETGGKNAIVISSSADRDLAIKELIHSAFGHAGQKCSAASLAIVEADVYDDPSFADQLRDATQSLPVGSAWDLRSVVTPLIRPPGAVLRRALTSLEPGESWLVQPRRSAVNERLWSPGIKWNVQPGSTTHRVEFFGPLLGVLRARNMDHALCLANGTPYGLTAGLFSLDEDEQAAFCARMQAGNLYINRGVTGAVVARQPFGGRKASSFGAGAKAGGPDYITQFCNLTDATDTADAHFAPDASVSVERAEVNLHVQQLLWHTQHLLDPRAQARVLHVASAFEAHFTAKLARLRHTQFLPGQFNLLRYQPRDDLVVVALPGLDHETLVVSLIAALTCAGGDTSVSASAKLVPDKHRVPLTLLTLDAAHQVLGTGLATWLEVQLVHRVDGNAALLHDLAHAVIVLGRGRVRRLAPTDQRADTSRFATPVGNPGPGFFFDDRPVSRVPWVELPRYCMEQSVSINYHRYGNPSARQLVESALNLPASPILDG